MESVFLLGCFIAIGIGGFFLMGKVDIFLNHIKYEDKENRKQTCSLRIAVSDFYTAYFISNSLSGMMEKYPDLQCTLWVGQEDELLHYFNKNEADVIVVSSNVEDSGHPSEYISLKVQPLKLNERAVTLTPLTICTQQRKIFWQNDKSHPLVPEFVKQLCQVRL